ncbi:hypothetical protein ACOI1C_15550 [Bacillus sp. DJP31]|uniref:hypothetical protein n=1 Tax=Bacillus sp. DJP31 TaxID=3409789 RepID=UPI003BB6C12C
MKKMSLVAGAVAITLLLPGVGMVNAAMNNETSSAFDEISTTGSLQERVDKRKQHFEKREQVITEAVVKYAPELTDDWNQAFQEREALLSELASQEVREEMKAGKYSKRHEVKAQFQELKDLFKNGEITKEDAKKLIKEKREELKVTRVKRKTESKEIKSAYVAKWKELKHAVKQDDAAKVNTLLNEYLDFYTKKTDTVGKRLEQFQNGIESDTDNTL